MLGVWEAPVLRLPFLTAVVWTMSLGGTLTGTLQAFILDAFGARWDCFKCCEGSKYTVSKRNLLFVGVEEEPFLLALEALGTGGGYRPSTETLEVCILDVFRARWGDRGAEWGQNA